MAKQTFTTGQVLTAAQVNALQANDYNQTVSTKTASYILVAADKGTRIVMNSTSATTITVNTGLFDAGDTLYIHNTNSGVCTITAGTATVATSGSLVLAQNQGGVLYFTSASASIFFQYATPASGDIEGVTAGTGISGGGTSGTVTITNSMATEIAAKGDLIVGTGSATFDNLTVGANGTVLTADSTVSPTGLKWAAASSGGFTELASGSLSSTSTVVNVTTTGYKQLVIYVKDVTCSADWFPTMRLNGDSGNNYTLIFQWMSSSTALGATNVQTNAQEFYAQQMEATVADNFQVFTVYDPANSTTYKTCNFVMGGKDVANTFFSAQNGWGQWRSTAAITSVTFTPLGGVTYSTGTYEIYGVK